MPFRQKLVVGNWKMHGTQAVNLSLLHAVRAGAAGLLAKVGVAVCVPFPYLPQARAVLDGSGVAWGAQTLSEHALGAYTGEVSGAMLNDFGCRFVLVGHSERRALYGETNAAVAAKFAAALHAGLTPVFCVGETLAERESGVTERVVAAQLDAVIARSGVKALASAIVAYEPVWAIGTGRTATPDQAQEVHAQIRSRIAVGDAAVATSLKILYGGSVKAGNAGELFAKPDIDGGLIGGAALVAGDFLQICAAAAAA
jgi:triosephosphate isomerase